MYRIGKDHEETSLSIGTKHEESRQQPTWEPEKELGCWKRASGNLRDLMNSDFTVKSREDERKEVEKGGGWGSEQKRKGAGEAEK